MFKTKVPFTSLIIPFVVPFSKIFAPMIGTFVASTTVPVIILDCLTSAIAEPVKKNRNKEKKIVRSLTFRNK
jgi:hypothetical protein